LPALTGMTRASAERRVGGRPPTAEVNDCGSDVADGGDPVRPYVANGTMLADWSFRELHHLHAENHQWRRKLLLVNP
jgi:hypothetical protein